jgi:methionyl-tRNA formyltransferase
VTPRTDGLQGAASVLGGQAGGRARTVFLGSGAFGAPALRRLAAHPDIDLVGIVTAPPRPVGRRQVPTPTPIGSLAGELGLGPVLAPTRLRAPEAVGAVLALHPDLAVLADYGQIVPAPLLGLPHGALNLHPSALPRWRGASPIPATIMAGDLSTAVTLMRMDEGLDTGPIVAQETVALAGDEIAPDLEARLAALAADLLDRSLRPWLRGELVAVPQAAEGVTLTRPLRREDGRLDPGEPAVHLERAVRALEPWPGSFLETVAGRLRVLSAILDRAEPGDAAGTLVAHGEGLALATAEGRLVLDRVQPAGGSPMSGTAFRRGRPSIVGASVLATGRAGG